jgi:hypothetical protein
LTIIAAERILQQPGAKLWQIAAHFEAAVRWVDGGVWRVQLRWDSSIDLEISDWREGERFGLRPLNMPPADDEVVLHQIVFDLRSLSDNQTKASVQCEYAPCTRLAKIKNLVFWRRQYFHRLEASLEALERLTREQAV